MCRKAEINFKFRNRDLGDISCWSKFLTKNIQFLKWKSTKISNAEISWSRNIGHRVSFISNIRSTMLMGTKDIWICANCTKKRKIVCAHILLKTLATSVLELSAQSPGCRRCPSKPLLEQRWSAVRLGGTGRQVWEPASSRQSRASWYCRLLGYGPVE